MGGVSGLFETAIGACASNGPNAEGAFPNRAVVGKINDLYAMKLSLN